MTELEFLCTRIELLLMMFGLAPLLVVESVKVKREEKKINMIIMGEVR